MRTRKKSAPKRYSNSYKFDEGLPTGHSDSWLHSAEFRAQLGSIAVRWAHLEEWLGRLFSALLTAEIDTPNRVVFAALNGADKRRQVMEALLRTRRNIDLGPEFDDYLKEFNSLRVMRNRLMHGLWWTHLDTGDSYIQDVDDGGEHPPMRARKVDLTELVDFDQTLRDFQGRMFELWRVALQHGLNLAEKRTKQDE